MAAKTVALDPESYSLLVRAKRPGETFSDVVRRTLRPPSRISDLAGALANEPPEVWREIEATRRADRRADRARQRKIERWARGK